MRPYYEDELAMIYHGDCREVMREFSSTDVLLTDPPFGLRAEGWDFVDSHEFARFTMSWLSALPLIANEVLIFGASDGPIPSLIALLFERVRPRPLIWHKPLGSQYAGSREARRWFAYETIYHCYPAGRGRVVEPRSLALGLELRCVREREGLSRGAVDFAVRGRKTGLCYRWEEGACIPTDEQVAILRQVLPSLDGGFDNLRMLALTVKATTLEKATDSWAEKSDVLSYRTVAHGRHPCEKPVGLIHDLLSTTDGLSVLDPFMGSGTTLVAAKDLGRRAVGIEIEERYCEIAAERLSQEVLALSAPEAGERSET